MADRVTHRVVTLIVVAALLLAMSFAMDPILGRPDTTCVAPPTQLLVLLEYPPGCQ
jgi:hypothetical protein